MLTLEDKLKGKDLSQRNFSRGNNRMSDQKGEEHKDKMKNLGNVELSQNVFIDVGTEKEEQNQEKTKTTVFKFLKGTCGEDAYYKRTIKNVQAVQNFANEDIRNILVFIANLEDKDVKTYETSYSRYDGDKIISTLPSSLIGYSIVLNEDKILQTEKVYVILVLINFGVSPAKIKKCLENKSNKNENLFKDLN